ncbi:hypothetical protein SLS64_008777 [Diaporthe eres]
MATSKLDVLSATAADLRDLLQAKQVSSVQLVKAYLGQIAEHDAALNAFICLAPEQNVVATAALLDKERLEGRVRGPLHGIPVVLKDCFVSAEDLGMSTTAGSWALVGAKSSKNSAMVQKLVDAGLIILGKTNMTEFAGMKMTMMMPGWSGYGGQTISPYVGKIEDGETILGHSESKYISCVDNLKSTACQLQYPISVPDISVLTVDEEDAIMPIALRNLEDIVRFNQQNKDKAMPERQFQPLIQSCKRRNAKILPAYTEQGDIIKAFENVDTEENVARLRDGLRKKARSVLEPVFHDNGINIIAAPADSSLCIHAAAAGKHGGTS